MIETLVKYSAGMDVHLKSVTCTALNEQENGGIVKFAREYPPFRAPLREMARWLVELEVELAVRAGQEEGRIAAGPGGRRK